MIALRSALFNLLFWSVIALTGFALPLVVIFPPLGEKVARFWAKSSLWLLKVICNISYQVKGSENIPKSAALIVSKHQSAWETIIFWQLLEKPVFVLKRELIFLPVFGSYLLLLKSIYIDRKAGSSALKKMLRQAKQRAAENKQIIIFPEGTRTLPQAAKTVYQSGVAALYGSLNLPVIPVALNSGYFWQKNAFIKQPGIIKIEFLPPILPGLKSRDFMLELESQIESACKKL
ncbi:MAG: lysophospholipid acyltransferase family protein [Pseudomonadota bacterium]